MSSPKRIQSSMDEDLLKKKYKTAAEILDSKEFKEYQDMLYNTPAPNENSIIGRIAKNKGIKLKSTRSKIPRRSIMYDINEFFNSKENEL